MDPGLRFSIMYFLDQTAGSLICGVLGFLNAFSKVFRFSQKNSVSQPPKTILILKWFGIGSLVFIQPLLKNLKKTYPDCKIIFLTFEGNRKLLEAFGNCDEICSLRMGLFFPLNALRMIFHLRKARPDAGIDLEFYSGFSTLMLFLSGSRRRLGFNLPYFWRSSLLTDPFPFNYFRHITEVYRAAGRAIGIDYEDLKPQALEVSSDRRSKIAGYLKEKGMDEGEKLVGVNVNAGEMAYARRWPAHYFIRLIESILQKDQSVRIILTGSKDEKQYVQEMYNNLAPDFRKRAINSAGELSLAEFIALISMMDLFISNDSGPLHLAYAQDVPTVSFWGPGSPSFYALKEKKHLALYAGLDCSPCLYVYRMRPAALCRNKAWCLAKITPEQALSCALRLLTERETS